MTAEKFIGMIARLTPMTINSTDDQLEDAIATINRLIEYARELDQTYDWLEE